jgi:hypothetical protein
MDKELLIDAIVGAGFPTMEFAIQMEKSGLARFSGNQWNEDWEWRRDALNKLDNNFLLEMIYAKIKELRKKS